VLLPPEPPLPVEPAPPVEPPAPDEPPAVIDVEVVVVPPLPVALVVLVEVVGDVESSPPQEPA
jgi:hypothetical protein